MLRSVLLAVAALAGSLACGGDDDGDGGGTDAGGLPSASEFCADYEETCGFGDPPDRFQEAQDCIAEYGGYSTTRKECVVEHLGLAESDADLHCPDATGGGPCT